MDDALLLLTAKRNLRRKYGNYAGGIGGAPNLAGLAAFADGLAGEASGQPVTITAAGTEGS